MPSASLFHVKQADKRAPATRDPERPDTRGCVEGIMAPKPIALVRLVFVVARSHEPSWLEVWGLDRARLVSDSFASKSSPQGALGRSKP